MHCAVLSPFCKNGCTVLRCENWHVILASTVSADLHTRVTYSLSKEEDTSETEDDTTENGTAENDEAEQLKKVATGERDLDDSEMEESEAGW